MAEMERFNPKSRKNEEIHQESLSGERALYRGANLKIYDTVFHDGESPLKESRDIELYGTEFQWKYPLWYSKNVYVKDCVWQPMARSGVWYTEHMTVDDSMIWGPKNFRRCKDITIRNTSLPDAAEMLWSCSRIRLEHVTAKGDYFGMNSSDIYIDGLDLYGNYAFDGGRNIEIHNSKLLTKDCFWNCENVTIDADIRNRIDSVLNPGSGKITARTIANLIIESDNCDASKTCITIKNDKDKPACRITAAV